VISTFLYFLRKNTRLVAGHEHLHILLKHDALSSMRAGYPESCNKVEMQTILTRQRPAPESVLFGIMSVPSSDHAGASMIRSRPSDPQHPSNLSCRLHTSRQRGIRPVSAALSVMHRKRSCSRDTPPRVPQEHTDCTDFPFWFRPPRLNPWFSR
jgi:hypothetical protein